MEITCRQTVKKAAALRGCFAVDDMVDAIRNPTSKRWDYNNNRLAYPWMHVHTSRDIVATIVGVICDESFLRFVESNRATVQGFRHHSVIR